MFKNNIWQKYFKIKICIASNGSFSSVSKHAHKSNLPVMSFLKITLHHVFCGENIILKNNKENESHFYK